MKKVFSFILKTAITFIVISIIWVIVYRFVPIPGTLLMLSRNINDNAPIHYDWQPLGNISPHLALAVVSSEDNLFTQHNGFDIDAIKLAQEEAKKGKKLRGASTISQQTAKNVFLWNGRSWVRKGLEAYFTVLIELIWGKERIMEVYLNCIEMGNGIYGASAVAKHHFGTSADKLTKSQCALIAATLPNPRKYNSAKPSKYMLKRQSDILKLMKYIGKVDYNNTTDKKKSK